MKYGLRLLRRLTPGHLVRQVNLRRRKLLRLGAVLLIIQNKCMHDEQSIHVKIAELYFNFRTNPSQILLDSEGPVKYFRVPDRKEKTHYTIRFSVESTISLSGYRLVFSGEPESNEILNYSWYVYQSEDEKVILVEFKDHKHIKKIAAKFLSGSTDVEINIVVNDSCAFPVVVDPFIHPLGSLLLLYLVHWKQGILIHGAAVEENGSAYLFTGVSGIGKSTMARLWKECGANVLNDDRLIIRVFDKQVMLYNNPMPYYKQEPGEAVLKKIFLLKQSPDNYIKPLRGVHAYSRVLGNCIQQFYRPGMIKKHLGIVEEVLDKVSVYEIGFRPDIDIVRLIRKMDKDEG